MKSTDALPMFNSQQRVRKFLEEDYPFVVDIYAKSKLDELANERQKFVLLPLEQDERRLANLLESEIYVYDDGRVCGYSALYGSEIRALFVHPDFRGKGIGTQLLTHLLSRVIGEAILYVAKTNFSAKKLYEKYGFKIIEEFETTYNGIPVVANKMIRGK
jgi:putative acetyltransferase